MACQARKDEAQHVSCELTGSTPWPRPSGTAGAAPTREGAPHARASGGRLLHILWHGDGARSAIGLVNTTRVDSGGRCKMTRTWRHHEASTRTATQRGGESGDLAPVATGEVAAVGCARHQERLFVPAFRDELDVAPGIGGHRAAGLALDLGLPVREIGEFCANTHLAHFLSS